ncbi:mannosyl-N-acetyl-alpha-D-glucosaminyl-diphospho-ditrans,octacis-undecaprenol 3-alpha-mannosyltransferase / alpha-1,3-rhamnosyltransferase [Nitratiruptor sp. YY08-26]|uniref:glycosyltransferase family 4 protein n=1 Tax=unclassified Nitratiruptor TaxID=2624044 RepID=UPI001915F17F|nr:MULTISPECIES: glycosyltransferase family 1 protein [unclassified Nitratiruptor]BCD62056.1 mannosyl-N-acetyl-alpha-D-glucosaminyl-diphospho-ditrans,octacis-undecaprenol 3-alpha-mannosyltransferase / alpha-1,3-rhamnosyltransferase [Nitratiruptor sp. YY08-13]BCD65992.1 mannosyl-N-acetyl-alpha-D-glucosaminyl-diphospho-ditrans,octacis-undecaprenol 3-alpha-mannosyltransferase / alpha-1,3-rhamnosyltransferase [Nitratiruptor sp. YY08-26]
MKHPKILIDTTPLLKDLSGVGYVTYQYAKELQKIYPNTLYYYAWFYSKELRQRALGNYEKAVNLAKKYLPRPYILTHSAKTAIFNYTLLKEKPDVFIQPNYISFPTFFDIPTITFIHDLSHIRYKEYHPKERVEYFEKYLPKSIEKSTKIVTISEFTKHELIDLSLCDKEKIEVIYNGVDPKFRPTSYNEFISITKRYNLQYQNYFLFVGTLEPRKNLKNLLAAYLQYLKTTNHPTPLVLAGGVGWRSEHFDDLLQKALNSGYVKRLGYVSEEDLIALYGGAKAFVFPSFYEGFGLPPLEAMACGTPVIASNSSSIPEVVGDAGILIDPYDVQQICKALQRIDEDEKLRKSLATKGLKRAKAFSWQKATQNLAKLIEKNI